MANDFDPRWVRILEATRELFLRYGYAHTSMKAIADKTHVSKATLYAYWTTKQDLFNCLILWESLHTLDDWLRRIENDPQGDKIGHMLAQGMIAVEANSVLHVLYSRDMQTLGDLLRERGTELTDRRYVRLLELIRTLQGSGMVRTDLPAEHINHYLTTISVGIVTAGEQYNPAQFPPFEQLSTSLGELIQSALEPRSHQQTGEKANENKEIVKRYLIGQRQETVEALNAFTQIHV